MQVLITGASGRLGRMLQALWLDAVPLGFQPIWSVRIATDSDHLAWDVLSDAAPDLPRGGVILHLAGILRGSPAALSANSAMALKVCAAAKSAGASHVFLASSAAVYGPGFGDHVETKMPSPSSDYGRAKLATERAAFSWARDAGPRAPGITCLRIGNVLGADSLFDRGMSGQDVVLDPCPGQPRGPQRSYIGPVALGRVLADLIVQTLAGVAMPPVLNVAAPGPVFMADLLDAARMPFRFGPYNDRVMPRVGLCTTKLSGMMVLSAANAASMVADWRRLSAIIQ